MAKKTWDKMTQTEKIEDLRRDVVRLFDALNQANHRITSLGGHIERIQTTAMTASREVEALKAQLKKDDGA